MRHIVGSRTLSSATEFMSSTSQCEHTRHGSGAVILRASRNAGDKLVKRKRGGRSAATIAARIERGYLKRSGTAGSTACDTCNRVDDRGTTTDGSGDVLPLSTNVLKSTSCCLMSWHSFSPSLSVILPLIYSFKEGGHDGCEWCLIAHQYLRIRENCGVTPLSHRRLKPWPFSDFFCDSPASLLCVFHNLGHTLNHHRSTHIFHDTPCVKCRRLESKIRASMLSEVHLPHFGFKSAGVAPLPPRFRTFLDETVKAIAFFPSC